MNPPMSPDILSELRYGYFCDPMTGKPILDRRAVVYVRWLRDGTRDMILTKSVIFVDPRGRAWKVPAGTRINGLSVPRFFWRLVQPYEPLSREASVVHDYLCQHPELADWDEAADIFYWAMRANGVSEFGAIIRWAAVKYIGRFFYRRRSGRKSNAKASFGHLSAGGPG